MKSRLVKFRWFCAVGLVGSLIVWMLPVSLKPYHIKRYLNDWTKNFIVEQVSEIGFDADGLVKVRYSREFESSDAGAIDRIRREWYDKIVPSRTRWPTDGKRLHYDEWGPSNWKRDDGVHEVEVGAVYCMPYSFMALVCALPLLWWVWEIILNRFSKQNKQELA